MLPSRCSFARRLISCLRYHIMDRINNRAGSFPSDSMPAVFRNNLTSLGRKLRRSHLQQVRPDFMKSLELFACLRGTHSKRPPRRQHNQWTIAKITLGVRFGRALRPRIAPRSHEK